jgi:hypothetical protein
MFGKHLLLLGYPMPSYEIIVTHCYFYIAFVKFLFCNFIKGLHILLMWFEIVNFCTQCFQTISEFKNILWP